MTERDLQDHRRARTGAEKGGRLPFSERWHGRAALLLLSIGLLTFASAPFNQFYLAYFGIVPWLLVLRRTRSQRGAFLLFWAAGIAFFTVNMWWLVYVTAPGMAALMVMEGLAWGILAVLIRGTGLLHPFRRNSKADTAGGIEVREPRPSLLKVTLGVVLIPVIWVSVEWLRGNFPFNGLPWLFLGHTQLPVLPLCQIADFSGVYGISFWMAAVNVLIASAIVHRRRLRRLVPAALLVAGMTAGIVVYGNFRLSEQTTRPGPRVLVVQPNYPQSNTGDKGAEPAEMLAFHVRKSEEALEDPATGKVDLVVWSETMLPFLNAESRAFWQGYRLGDLIEQSDRQVSQLAAMHGTAFLVGGSYAAGWSVQGQNGVASEKHNSAYYYLRDGSFSPQRYDKMHLVPAGEYLPFKETIPALYSLMNSLSPYDAEYWLQPGRETQEKVFMLDGPPAPASQRSTPSATDPAPPAHSRFVTPICFEDIDPILVASMFRGKNGKAADFIVNITNDGWFRGSEMSQHLQGAAFRCIENRVPLARSVNTGISGFVDSCGRMTNLIPVNSEGTRVATLSLDARYTVYTRHGDAFATGCAALTGVMCLVALVRWWKGRRMTGEG